MRIYCCDEVWCLNKIKKVLVMVLIWNNLVRQSIHELQILICNIKMLHTHWYVININSNDKWTSSSFTASLLMYNILNIARSCGLSLKAHFNVCTSNAYLNASFTLCFLSFGSAFTCFIRWICLALHAKFRLVNLSLKRTQHSYVWFLKKIRDCSKYSSF